MKPCVPILIVVDGLKGFIKITDGIRASFEACSKCKSVAFRDHWNVGGIHNWEAVTGIWAACKKDMGIGSRLE